MLVLTSAPRPNLGNPVAATKALGHKMSWTGRAGKTTVKTGTCKACGHAVAVGDTYSTGSGLLPCARDTVCPASPLAAVVDSLAQIDPTVVAHLAALAAHRRNTAV